jgi:hypothetical protein
MKKLIAVLCAVLALLVITSKSPDSPETRKATRPIPVRVHKTRPVNVDVSKVAEKSAKTNFTVVARIRPGFSDSVE